ncbi:hypothetical protein WAX86_05395 [Photobacterium damselae subsp. damselae]|uniref:hypothetical protein n=1 Tax=Photobacterium damselae TaxID=38293 RepID=UPI00311AC74D
MKKRIWVPIVGLVLVSFTSIPRVTYYKAMKYVLEPSIWNEIVVITGAKPNDMKIYGNIMIDKCGLYSQSRKYTYKAEDLGSSYRLELPIINKDNSCQKVTILEVLGKKSSVSYSLWGFRTLGSAWAQNVESKKIDSSLTAICEIKSCNVDGYVKGSITYSDSYIQSLRNIKLNVEL